MSCILGNKTSYEDQGDREVVGSSEAALSQAAVRAEDAPHTWELLLVQSHGHPKSRVQFLVNLHFLKRDQRE